MAKRQNEYFSLKDLMGEFIKENNLSSGMKKISVKEAWEDLMGNGVVSYTEKVELRNGTLFVKLTSVVLLEKLIYGKDKFVKMMNEHLGSNDIKKIMLL